MKRNILYLLSIGICLFTCVGSHAAAPETRAHLERGRSLFDHGRWTDARYELLKAREGADRDLEPIETEKLSSSAPEKDKNI